MMESTLATRIRERLEATEQSANAASEAAGLDRDYIGDLLKDYDNDKRRNPRVDTIDKLAKALRCDGRWLATGRGTPSGKDALTEAGREAATLIAELPQEQQENALTILRALHARAFPTKAS